jgi:hypothetical protein
MTIEELLRIKPELRPAVEEAFMIKAQMEAEIKKK